MRLNVNYFVNFLNKAQVTKIKKKNYIQIILNLSGKYVFKNWRKGG